MSGSADGPGPDARFFIPLDIAVDGSDNLFIADFGNNSIRKITPEGIVSTLAGGTYGYSPLCELPSPATDSFSYVHPIHISKSAIAALTLPLAPSAICRVRVIGNTSLTDSDFHWLVSWFHQRTERRHLGGRKCHLATSSSGGGTPISETTPCSKSLRQDAGDSRQDGGAPRRRRPTMGAEKQSDGSLGRGDDGIAGGEGTEVA